MNKKILIGAGIVTLLILIGGFWWLMRGEEAGEGGFRNLFPFGQSDTVPDVIPQGSTSLPSVETDNAQAAISVQDDLRLISKNAVSGATFLENGTTTSVRFVERATGHIFDANLETGVIERISNTTIPKIERISWKPEGDGFLGQFLDLDASTVQTKAVEIAATTTESGFRRIDEFFLPENILELDVSPQGNAVFYLVRGRSGVEGVTASPRGANPEIIWQFPTSEWIPDWKTNTLISLTSKAGNGVPGFLYFLNTGNGETSLALSGILGLTANVSPSGENVLYSESDGRTTTLRFLDQKQRADAGISLGTLPEKCVWASETALYCAVPRTLAGILPDEWYQGIVSFTDTLWKIDLNAEEFYTQTSDLSGAEGGIDAVNLELSSGGEYLLFMNKKDLSLWAIAL